MAILLFLYLLLPLTRVYSLTEIPIISATAPPHLIGHPNYRIENAIDGTGLSGTFPNQTHAANNSQGYWAFDTVFFDDPSPYFVFNFSGVTRVQNMHFWNWNNPGETCDGASNCHSIKNFQLHASTDGGTTFPTLLIDSIFPLASGLSTYEGVVLSLPAGTMADAIRLTPDNARGVGNYNGNRIGFAEIKFSYVPEPQIHILLANLLLLSVVAYSKKRIRTTASAAHSTVRCNKLGGI